MRVEQFVIGLQEEDALPLLHRGMHHNLLVLLDCIRRRIIPTLPERRILRPLIELNGRHRVPLEVLARLPNIVLRLSIGLLLL